MVDSLPGVTVVVPTLNRGTYLLDTVRDLLAQTHRPLEILIVDQPDTVSPELEALVAAHADVISHHRVGFRGLPIARNYGWQMARHELIVYIDDDIRCEPNMVAVYVDSFTETGVKLIGGGVDEGEATGNGTRMPWYDRLKAYPEGSFSTRGRGPADHAKGCNFGVRRSVLDDVRGFDESLSFGAALHEETELCLRVLDAGYEIWFTGAARLTHLAAGGGGTRQPDWRRYVHALAHNRSILIRRHSRWYQWPVGLGWSAKLVMAYTRHYRDPRILPAGFRGMVAGWRAGGQPPVCTRFDRDRD